MKALKRAVLLAAIMMIVSVAGVYSAYMAHKDKDSPVVLAAYPQLAGAALDDCALCHRRGEAPAPGDPSGELVPVNSCDYCHHVVRGGEKHAGLTLNSYGFDYLSAGADAEALAEISGMDSDGDGVSNSDEIAQLTMPGDAESRPGVPEAPHVVLSLDELKRSGLPIVEQTIFVNVSKSREGDSYRTFRGFRVEDVIEYAGVAEGVESIDLISVDTYRTAMSMGQLAGVYEQSPPVFGLGMEDLGECGWVKYEAEGLEEGKPLPPAGVLLTFEMGGVEYGPATLDPGSGKLRGYGPFRLVAPQMIEPGLPDISSRATHECIDKVPGKYHYRPDGSEKNSDYCVKSVVAIRANPLPEGTVDYNWQKEAMDLLEEGRIVVYGAIVPKDDN